MIPAYKHRNFLTEMLFVTILKDLVIWSHTLKTARSRGWGTESQQAAAAGEPAWGPRGRPAGAQVSRHGSFFPKPPQTRGVAPQDSDPCFRRTAPGGNHTPAKRRLTGCPRLPAPQKACDSNERAWPAPLPSQPRSPRPRRSRAEEPRGVGDAGPIGLQPQPGRGARAASNALSDAPLLPTAGLLLSARYRESGRNVQAVINHRWVCRSSWRSSGVRISSFY